MDDGDLPWVKELMNYFRKDPCIHTRTRGVNVQAHVLSRRNARAHVYAPCARMCARIFMKNLLMILYYLINKSLIKIEALVEDIFA